MRFFLPIVLILAFTAGCSRDPNVRKQKYLKSGNEYMEQGKYREAVIQFANAIKIDRGYAPAHYGIAQAYMRLQLWNGAYAELLRTVELQPDNLKAQLDLGNLFLGAKQPAQAAEKAKLVISKDSRNADAYVLLANVAAFQNQRKEALQQMQKALELSPDKSQYHLNNAMLLANDNQFPAAEAAAKKALQLDSKSLAAYEFLASLYGRQQKWSETEQMLRGAVDVAPKSLDARVRLAGFYLSQQKKDQAEQVVTEAKKALADVPESHGIVAEFLLRQGQNDRALAEFAAQVKQYPKDTTLKKRYTEVLLLAQHNDEAGKLTDEILKNNPNDVEGLIFRASLQLQQQKAADAVTALQSAIKADAQNAFAHYMLGLALNANGDRQRAEGELKEAVRLRPTLLQAQRALAEFAAASGNLDQLSTTAEAMIQNAPAWPEGYIRRSQVEFARKQMDKAEADLQKAMQIAPNDPAGYVRFGQLRLGQKRYSDAEKLLEAALQHGPENTEALSSLAGVFLAQQQPDKAMARVKAQIEKAPNVSGFYSLLGTLQASRKNFAEAEVSLQKASELDKNNLNALILLGQVQAAAGSPDRAMKSWETLAKQNPKDVRAYLMLAGLYESRNDWQKAQELLKKALDVQPDYPLAANNLAYLMLQHGGNTDVALTLAQTARRAMPDAPNVADTLAWAYYQKGVYSSAIDLLNEALNKQPNNATMRYHLGLAYQKVNKSAQARDQFEKALKLNPSTADADAMRKALQQLGRG